MTRSLLTVVDGASAASPTAAPSNAAQAQRTPRAALPEADIRRRIDEAFRRGWREIARRFGRVAVLGVADFAASALAVLVAVEVGTRLGAVSTAVAGPMSAIRPLLIPVYPVQLLALHVFGAYGPGNSRVSFRRVMRGIGLAVVLVWLQTILGGVAPIPGSLLLIYAPVGGLMIYGGRILVDRCIQAAYRKGIGRRRVIFIGLEQDIGRLHHPSAGREGADIDVVRLLTPDQAIHSIGSSGPHSLEEILRASRAAGVIIGSTLRHEDFEALVRHCFELGATVSVVPQTIERIGAVRLELREAGSGVLLKIAPAGLRLPQLALKRCMDLVLATIGLIVVSPIMLLIAVAIKLDSPGPVLFSQIRAGLGGRPFRMFKFRTMVADADAIKQQLQHLNESGDPRLFKIRNDPRITRVGRILRKTSLDELPQLFNVVRGEMSLVGPRPFFPDDLASYEDHHFERLYVLPGITGLWQISGRSDVVDFEEVVRLDRAYIRGWSLWRDLAILLRTVPAAFGRGAY